MLIAGCITPLGVSAKLLVQWREGKVEIITSPRLLEELSTVLQRPKFRKYITSEEADQYVAIIARQTTLVSDLIKITRQVQKDPYDDYLVALAQTEAVHVIVSGDRHLIEEVALKPPVITPAEFLKHVQSLA